VANMQLRHLRVLFSKSLYATRLVTVDGLQGVITLCDRVDFGDRAAVMAVSAEVQA
jgi:hypothetical protein